MYNPRNYYDGRRRRRRKRSMLITRARVQYYINRETIKRRRGVRRLTRTNWICFFSSRPRGGTLRCDIARARWWYLLSRYVMVLFPLDIKTKKKQTFISSNIYIQYGLCTMSNFSEGRYYTNLCLNVSRDWPAQL